MICLKSSNLLKCHTAIPFDLFRARSISARVCPDVVHGQGISENGFIATHQSRPSVITVHGIPSAEIRLEMQSLKNKLDAWVTDRLMTSSLSQASIVTSISSYDAELVKNLVRGKHIHIPNPVDARFFGVKEGPGQRSTILYAGRVIPRKGLLDLIEALAEVRKRFPGVELRVAGELQSAPNYVASCRRTVHQQRLENNVFFLGALGSQELLKEYRRSTLLVLCSKQETSPVVIAEAMACGRPVVASRVCGIPEMVQDRESGLLVDVADIPALANAISLVLGDRQLQERMGNRGREIAFSRYQAASVARDTIEAYRMAQKLGAQPHFHWLAKLRSSRTSDLD